MHKSAILLLAIVFLTASNIVTYLPVKAEPKTIVVPDDYPTIQAAIENASVGDTVFVRKGTYYVYRGLEFDTKLFINKSINLIGENSLKTMIVPDPEFHEYYITKLVGIKADYVKISGFTIKGESKSLSVDGSGCTIIGNNVIGEVYIGGENNTISQNNITKNRLYVGGSNNVIVGNNVTGSAGAGIVLDTCKNVTIRDNNIVNNGLNPEGSPHFNGGLYLNGGPFYVYRNNITDNNYFGIEFYWNCSNTHVFNNNILRNKIGISLPLMPSRIIGVGNEVYNNNLIDNEKNVAVEQAGASNNNIGEIQLTDVVSWDNGLVGNYWSDYSGQGAYVIDENNIDRRPLTQPVDIYTTAPELSTLLITIGICIFVIIGVGLLFYFKKRKH